MLLTDIQEAAAPTPTLQRMAAEFTKVTASYGAQVLPCYEVAGLAGPTNDLEHRVGELRYQLRRATGQQNAPASLVVAGAARLPAALSRRTHPFTATALQPADLARWRPMRARLQHRHWPRILGRRFRRHPEAYLQELQERLVKRSWPP